MSRRAATFGFIAAGVAGYALLATWALCSDSSVADEHPHILSGLLYWQSGQFAGGIGNPPLGQLWIAAPLAWFHLPYAFPSDTWLAWARVPVLVLVLTLVVLLCLWANRIAGLFAAAAVIVMLCLEPNLLAHGHLATLDAPFTVLWWWSLWAFRRILVDGARWDRYAVFALVFAACMLVKFTAVVLGPACLCVGLWAAPNRRRWQGAAAVGIGLVAFVVLSHAVYGWGAVRWGLSDGLVDAFASKIAHRRSGHTAYLAGQQSTQGFAHYYLAVLAFKTPLALVALALAGLLGWWRRLSRLDRALLLLPALLLVAAATWSRVHVGVRHILPVYPALILCAGLGADLLVRRGRRARLVLVALVVAWIVGFARSAPQYVAYFNMLAGGPAGGHRWLLDSNLDWGQDDKRLARFLARAAARGEHWEVNPQGERARAGRFAVNASTLHALLRPGSRRLAWLRDWRAEAFAGYAWHLFALDIADFEARAKERPHDRTATIAHAQALAFADRKPEARALLQQALSRSNDPAFAAAACDLALEDGDLAAAATWARRGLQAAPQDAWLGYLGERVGLELALGNATTAADSAARALALGLWWAQQGEIEPAVPYLQRAVAQAPENVAARAALGVARARQGEFAAARQVLEGAARAGDLEPEIAAVRRLEQALAQRARAEAGGEDADIVLLRELAMHEFDDERYDRAAAALLQLLRQQPSDAMALLTLGEMHVRCKLRVVNTELEPRRVDGSR